MRWRKGLGLAPALSTLAAVPQLIALRFLRSYLALWCSLLFCPCKGHWQSAALMYSCRRPVFSLRKWHMQLPDEFGGPCKFSKRASRKRLVAFVNSNMPLSHSANTHVWHNYIKPVHRLQSSQPDIRRTLCFRRPSPRTSPSSPPIPNRPSANQPVMSTAMPMVGSPAP